MPAFAESLIGVLRNAELSEVEGVDLYLEAIEESFESSAGEQPSSTREHN